MMSVDLQCSVFRIGWDVDNKEEFQTILVLLMLVTNVDCVNDVGGVDVGVGVGVGFKQRGDCARRGAS